MRLVYLCVGIIIFIIFTFVWFVVPDIDLLQYRAVRVGYTRFYQLIDSLFNEFQTEGDDEIEDMFEPYIQTNEYDEDATFEKLTCYTWSSLNDLIRINHERLMDASKNVHVNPRKLHDQLQKDLEITNAMVKSYNTRLRMEIEHLPSFLLSHQNQLKQMLATLNDINRGFQYLIGDAINKIDRDQYELQKSSGVRIARILQQFELVIQSQNEAHLDCTCDVAKHLDAMVQDLVDKIHLCVNITGDQFSDYIKETITPMANSMETTIRSVSRGIKRSKTSVEVFYQLPMKVRKPMLRYRTFFH